jgi:hypothetical protein
MDYNGGYSFESVDLNRKRASLPHVNVSEDSLQCEGDDCDLTCKPFDPEAAPAFEFVGTLRVDIQPDGMQRLFLDAIDLSVSRQLVGKEWRSIPETTGSYHFP